MSRENIKQLSNLLQEAGYNVTAEELAELSDRELEAIFGGSTAVEEATVTEPKSSEINPNLPSWLQRLYPFLNRDPNNQWWHSPSMQMAYGSFRQ